MKGIEGKRAVVTGAAQGIDAAIARRLAADGACVAVLDLKIDAAAEVLPAPRLGLACDVGDSASVDRAVAQIKEVFGGVDILVNNAGIGSDRGDGMAQFYPAQAQRREQLARGETPRCSRTRPSIVRMRVGPRCCR